MSIEQPTLDDFDVDRDEVEEVDEGQPKPKWDPGTRARRCNNCDEHVPPGLARGLRDDEGRIHACPQCTGQSDAVNGESAGIDVNTRVGNPLSGGGF